MKKNLFTIEDSEKQRILEMHLNATQKLYLNEQGEVASTGSTASTTTFAWAEDDAEWVKSSGAGGTGGVMDEKKVSEENYRRFTLYYKTGSRIVSNTKDNKPGTLSHYPANGKIVYVFNKVQNPYRKSNLKTSFTVLLTAESKYTQSGQQVLNLLSGNNYTKPFLTIKAACNSDCTVYHKDNTSNELVESPAELLLSA